MNFFRTFWLCFSTRRTNSAPSPIALYYREHNLFCYTHLKSKPVYQGIRYGIPNEALVGACFIPLGLGSMSMYIPIHSQPFHIIS